ncbi:MAG: AI-2E family transporter [Syntrophomonadaceae bacterium]|jgi:predicted PurR-regulated permease PerM
MLNSHKISRYIIFFAVLITAAYLLYLVRDVLITFFLGALLAFLLYRPVLYIQRKGLKRIWAILILYLVFASIFAFIIILAVPVFIREMSNLAELYPEYTEKAQQIVGRINRINTPEQLNEVINNNLNKFESKIYEVLNNFLTSFYSLLGKIFALIFSPILAFYIMNDWERIKEGFLNLFPPRIRQEITMLGQQIDNVLVEFIKGHFLVSAFVGLATGISAVIIGVKFPLLIGLISGVTNLVPYFGPILGGIPAIALAVSESIHTAFYMAIAIIVIQQLESNLITPRIIGDKLGLHPLVIVFALLAGGKLFGIWGMLFAVPVTAVLKVLISWGYLKLVE